LSKSVEIDTPLALRRWLDEATAGLPAPTRARVEAEVTAHFEELRTAALVRGLPEIDALFEAVNTLGAAKRARKGFHRAYLTVRDEETLARWLMGFDQAPRRWWSVRWEFWMTLYAAGMTYFFVEIATPILSATFMVMAALVIVLGACTVAMSISLRQHQLRRTYFWIANVCSIISTYVFGLAAAIVFIISENNPGSWFTWLLPGFFFVLLPLLSLRNFGLLRKLPRVLSDEEVERLRVVAKQIESRKKSA